MGCDFSFIHCADLHLGSRFWGVNRKDPELGNRLYRSTFRSFSRIVDMGIRRADFMVISGDIYDDLVETPRTRIAFAKELERFKKPVFIVTGNHDHTHSWSDSIPYPPNVKVFGTTPERYGMKIGGVQVEVVGISFDGPHTDVNLVNKLKGTPGMFSIGVVHCSVDSIGEGNGYAPCSESDFLGRDIQYWALGHIHKSMVVREDPLVIYPGNIQGRDSAESGEKGCYLVNVTANHPEAEFIPTQEVIWQDVTADITGKTTVPQLIDSVRKDIAPDMIVSLTIAGKGPLNELVRSDPEAITEFLERSTGSIVNLRKLLTGPDIDLDKERNGETLISEIIRTSDSLTEMDDYEILGLLCSNGPAQDLRTYLEYFAKHGTLKELIKEAEMSAIGRLTEVRE